MFNSTSPSINPCKSPLLIINIFWMFTFYFLMKLISRFNIAKGVFTTILKFSCYLSFYSWIISLHSQKSAVQEVWSTIAFDIFYHTVRTRIIRILNNILQQPKIPPPINWIFPACHWFILEEQLTEHVVYYKKKEIIK